MDKPVVSVVMAAYNDQPEYLKLSIESILNQTFSDFEFLIVDDSNLKETIDILDSYADKDKRIQLIRNKQKLGFVPALNEGLKLAKGKYIARMDGDDISTIDRFEKQIKYLEKNPEISVVGSRINIINEQGQKTSEIKFPITSGFAFRFFAMLRCPMQHGVIMLRRELIDNGIRYDESFKRSEDLELWLRLLRLNYKMINLPDYLFSFRIESDYAKKRSKEHFRYNLGARKKNFRFKYLITGSCGIIISMIYSKIPQNLKHKIYNFLNNR